MTIEKGQYVPVKLICPCSTCLIKMICITACPVLIDFQEVTQFMTSLKCDDHKATINSWYRLKSKRHISNFFKDIDTEGISDRIKELTLIRRS
jgi:Fe-S oxidoreductase